VAFIVSLKSSVWNLTETAALVTAKTSAFQVAGEDNQMKNMQAHALTTLCG
jgi:hypothetical protein